MRHLILMQKGQSGRPALDETFEVAASQVSDAAVSKEVVSSGVREPVL